MIRKLKINNNLNRCIEVGGFHLDTWGCCRSLEDTVVLHPEEDIRSQNEQTGLAAMD